MLTEMLASPDRDEPAMLRLRQIWYEKTALRAAEGAAWVHGMMIRHSQMPSTNGDISFWVGKLAHGLS